MMFYLLQKEASHPEENVNCRGCAFQKQKNRALKGEKAAAWLLAVCAMFRFFCRRAPAAAKRRYRTGIRRFQEQI